MEFNGIACSSIRGRTSNRDELDRQLPPSPPAPPPTPPRPRVTYDPASLFYDMSGRKRMFIFNHYYYRNEWLETRVGTHHDVARLQETFGKPGRFEIEDPFNDLIHEDIIIELDRICEMNFEDTSCIAIVLLTHGNKNGQVGAADRWYPVNDVISRILHAPGLAGKPKLFFIQACRGGKTDRGMRVVIDGPVRVTIPTHSDCLVLKSTNEEFVSYRSPSEGSWMIQTLCKVLEDHYESLHFVDMVIHLNAAMAQKESFSYEPEYHDKKQIPEVTFTLTKFIKFY